MVSALVGHCALRGLEKEITLTFQRDVTVDAERQWPGSVKVKINLCQGIFGPRTQLLAMTSL